MKLIPLLTSACLLLCAACVALGEEKVYRGMEELRKAKAFQEVKHLDLSDQEYPSKIIDRLRHMPKLETLVVGGPRYFDRHMDDFAKLPSLRVLVLDSTDVTDAAIDKFKRAHTEATVYRSQRWAIQKLREPAPFLGIDVKLNEQIPVRLRDLIGEEFFQEVTEVEFEFDEETGPFDPYENEELMPIRLLPTLQRVTFGYCRLDDGGLRYLRGLTGLKQIWIVHPLEKITGEGLSHLRNLSELEVYVGPVDDDSAQHLAGFKKLKHLSFSPLAPARLSDNGLKHFSGLIGLEDLDLRDMPIDGSGLKHLKNCQRLKTLNLDNTPLRQLDGLEHLPALTALYLNNTQVNDAALAPLAKCTRLQSLLLTGERITDEGVAHLAELAELTELGLNGTNITDASAERLASLTRLNHLYLTGTKITDAALEKLATLPKLKTISLGGTKVTSAGIKKFKARSQATVQ